MNNKQWNHLWKYAFWNRGKRPQTLKTTQRKIFIKLTDQQAKTDFTISLIKMGLYVDFFYLSFLLCTVYIFVCHLFRDDSG